MSHIINTTQISTTYVRALVVIVVSLTNEDNPKNDEQGHGQDRLKERKGQGTGREHSSMQQI